MSNSDAGEWGGEKFYLVNASLSALTELLENFATFYLEILSAKERLFIDSTNSRKEGNRWRSANLTVCPKPGL